MSRLLAEFIGTFTLVLFGCGAAVLAGADIGLTGISLAFGLALVVIHLVGINVTGVSVNPARSIGPALVVGGTAVMQLWLFLVAPILGGVSAGMLDRAGLLTPPRV